MSDVQTVQSNPTTEPPAAVVQDNQAAASSTGTPQPTGEQAKPETPEQGALTPEGFTAIDPKTLPPELQALHKQLLGDYTRKTQDIADVRKRAEAFDAISQDQGFVDYWNGLNKQEQSDLKSKAEETSGLEISDEEFDTAFASKENFIKFQQKLIQNTNAALQQKTQEIEQQQKLSTAEKFLETYASKPGNEDFYDLDEFGFITYQLAVKPPKSEKEYASRVAEAHKNARETYKAIYEKGKSEALAIIQKKAETSSEMATNGVKNVYNGGDPKKLTAAEAVALARKGTKIPQNYD